MSICRVTSCAVARGFCYDQCVLLTKLCWPLSCFILYFKAKLVCYSRYLLASCFCISVSYDEKHVLFWCSFWKVFIEPFNFSFFGINNWGIDLDYCDAEWFALETNQDHSVVLEIAPTTAFGLLLTMRIMPFLLRDSFPQW